MSDPHELIDLLGDRDFQQDLIDDVLVGLRQAQKAVPPKWFYDARGSELFEQITRAPEYYPTEAERGILLRHAAEMVALSGADTLVELGSGVSDKTTALIDALLESGGRRYMPFDVSVDALQQAVGILSERYPALEIQGVIGDFDRHLGQIPVVGTRVVAFLGGTIGNYEPEGRQRLLADIVSSLQPGDSFLLGTDRVKDRQRLELAYNDAAGVTAEFNKNVLAVMNKRLGADFDLDAFEHLAYFDEEHQWITLYVRSLRAQVVTIPGIADKGADLVVSLAEGETIHTEISAKFTEERLRSDLAGAGLELVKIWSDDDFMVSLSKR